ncbi:MAG: flagellar protein FliT [Betaproteobacteria bacterium]|nr:flagellar protein FliT [Betaproteobacteria bacterium]
MPRPDAGREEACLSRYALVLALTHRMLEAARAGQWSTLVDLESGRRREMAEVSDRPPPTPETAVFQRRKADILREILAADQEVAALARARMDELSKALGIIGTRRRLQRAYTTG